MVVVLGEYLAWYLGVLEREAIAPEAKWAVLEGNITVSLCVNMDKEAGETFSNFDQNPEKSAEIRKSDFDKSGRIRKK